ncbi:MAG: flagellar filament outer layer protein FlaA [Treponema sp.]|jgi:hypothetical protein|nr:flagellar filament outer layer protein FlaA [Treponema sp.]
MKQIGFKIICLIVLACITVFSGFGQAHTTSLESRILESFNGDDDARYEWRATASRFITVTEDETFPKISYIEAWPIAAFGYSRDPGAPSIRSLGLHGKFDRRGYNWIDLYPVLTGVEANSTERNRMTARGYDPDNDPYEIPIPGKIQNMDVWVWGANLRFYIEVYLRDDWGVVHPLRLGDIAYPGWRNLRLNIPTSISQTRRTLPSEASLSFVKFRIWTQPVERVDNFYIYFKQLKILTDVFEQLFDGNDLADPRNVERLWAAGN